MESRESLHREVIALTSELLKLKSDLNAGVQDASSAIEHMSEGVESVNALLGSVQDLDDIVGRRLPKWYTVDIPFEYGDTAPKRGTIEISSNPFVCTQVQSLYFVTDTDPAHYPTVTDFTGPYQYSDTNAAGRSLPTSAYYATLTTLLYTYRNLLDMYPWSGQVSLGEIFSSYGIEADGTRYPGWNYPEFDFEISIVGSGRHWTNGKIPAAAFFGGMDPVYLAEGGIVEASDRIEVVAHPVENAITLSGIVKKVFFGYEIETEKRLSDIFGY